jgi:hypothetical protein
MLSGEVLFFKHLQSSYERFGSGISRYLEIIPCSWNIQTKFIHLQGVFIKKKNSTGGKCPKKIVFYIYLKSSNFSRDLLLC